MTWGQSKSAVRLQVPVRVLPSAQVDQPMMNVPGFVSSGVQSDPLSYYQRSRLGRWVVDRDFDAEDSVFGVELETPAGPFRIRYEISVDGQPFRAARGNTVDELLAIAKGEVANVIDAEEPNSKASDVKADPDAEPEAESTTAETYTVSSAKDRMAAYAKSRGDRLTRYELRRRIADIAGGPALLRTTYDFGSERNETLTLFAFLDSDEDGIISRQERDASGKALSDRDVNADGRVDWNELQRGLKPRSARRSMASTPVAWRSWNANLSEHLEDLSVIISFTKTEGESNLVIDNALQEPWRQATVEVQQIYAEEPHGQAILVSHPKIEVVLAAAQPADRVAELDQISVGIASEANALFRRIDQDGDWNLSAVERRSCEDVIAALDQDADGSLEVSELPVLLRVTVARGAVAHQALMQSVSVITSSDNADDQARNLVPPAWFISMDIDGDRTLSRQEFLGDLKSFQKMDADENNLLSVAESLVEKNKQ